MELQSTRRVVLAGGSGFLGRALADSFAADGWEVVILTRSPDAYAGPGRAVGWDGRAVGGWAAELDGAAAAVNLAGKSVDCRFTAAARRVILDSRVESVRAVAVAVRQCGSPPAVWVQAGAIGIYGDSGERVCEAAERFKADSDADSLGSGATQFLARACRHWEAAFHDAEMPETRKVLLRIGVVLGKGGGAWPALSGLARRFVGGPIGNGRQWVSWLHVWDFVRMVRWCINTPSAEKVYNAVAPNPVRNAELMRAIRSAAGRPVGLPIPSWAVRTVAAAVGTQADLALVGQRCSAARLTSAGFRFEYERIEEAARSLA